MALKSYKPTSPGQRGLVLVDKSDLWKGRPEKTLETCLGLLRGFPKGMS